MKQGSTVIASCTERDFLETILPYARRGEWECVYCGEAIYYPAGSDSVYLGPDRLECTVESLNGYHQLRPRHVAPGAANRCCSDRIARADRAIAFGRTILCPICGDAYTCAMVPRWGGSTRTKGYLRDEHVFAVDHDLSIPALVPIERLTSIE
ncbi:MAG: hypothetical protein ACR2PL_11020 [Dehalococcoidia bacterium]